AAASPWSPTMRSTRATMSPSSPPVSPRSASSSASMIGRARRTTFGICPMVSGRISSRSPRDATSTGAGSRMSRSCDTGSVLGLEGEVLADTLAGLRCIAEQRAVDLAGAVLLADHRHLLQHAAGYAVQHHAGALAATRLVEADEHQLVLLVGVHQGLDLLLRTVGVGDLAVRCACDRRIDVAIGGDVQQAIAQLVVIAGVVRGEAIHAL